MTVCENGSTISGMRNAWEFWIDRGGTFTDIVAVRPDGRLVVRKYLSDNPKRYADAATFGVHEIMAAAGAATGGRISAIKIGTTIATNALLERKGARTVFVTTKGFADSLRIGYQNRPKIFARRIELPEPLYECVIEADERMSASGETLTALDKDSLMTKLKRAREQGINSCAIAFMHSYKYPAHELAARELAVEAGFDHISLSHEMSRLIKLVARGDTTVADAYLSPVLDRYVAGVEANATQTDRILFMQSNGGLVDGKHFRGKDSLLSGPAGGVVGAIETSAELGLTRLISFDMGGTSTDVSHYNGVLERTMDNPISGIRIRTPMIDVHTVAAGGGSIVHFDLGRLQVGPESAGAIPGPACYRRGGPLTITDCNLLLGRIRSDCFPSVFGDSGDQPLDLDAVEQQFETLRSAINKECEVSWTSAELAERFVNIAVAKMASAIRKVSIERGHDIRDYALACFGGAGGQHACRLADALGLTKIVIHPLAGVLSAMGIGLSKRRSIKHMSIEEELSESSMPHILSVASSLQTESQQELVAQNVAQCECRRTALLKYQGTDFSLPVPFGSADEMKVHFQNEHLQRYGFEDSKKAIVVESVMVEAIEAAESAFTGRIEETAGGTPFAAQIFCHDRWREGRVIFRSSIARGQCLEGPCLIIDDTSTTVVEPDWSATLHANRALIVERRTAQTADDAVGSSLDRPDPATLELFNNLFVSAAEEMGLQLQSTSHSVNIKERLDFSCAIFDGDGNLIANAPHIPVHLGSMGESVKALLADKGPELKSGDAFAVNNPFNGGTHLPDITVISPVFDPSGRRVFFVASRGHHADIGGITPGSMPSTSRTLDEEGVVIDNLLLVRGGQFHEQELLRILHENAHPARNPEHNVADLKAQVAANMRGAQKLLQLIATHGDNTVRAYMSFVRANAAASVREVLDVLENGAFSSTMDDGSEIRVTISVDNKNRSAVIDFAGTSGQVSSNLNAPHSICRAAVMYVFRSLVDREIPLNDGCMEPLNLSVPPGSILNPGYPAAVVAGNVETSQAVTDCLYGALGALAASQGTMNNFTFGNDRFQYYETICGGAGAGPNWAGASAVHTHMTNSRLTDPEVLEMRFPVRLESFAIRRGSGGAGRFAGGDGVVRKLRFLQAMTASILSQRRAVAPFGISGGMPAEKGKNYVVRKDGTVEELPGTATVEMRAGDLFVIETPGGGGFGAPAG